MQKARIAHRDGVSALTVCKRLELHTGTVVRVTRGDAEGTLGYARERKANVRRRRGDARERKANVRGHRKVRRGDARGMCGEKRSSFSRHLGLG